MNIMIIGGDKVARNLVRLIVKHPEFNISVVEKRLETCKAFADDYRVRVYHGDGSNLDVLRAANCQESDVFLALTGKDEDNLLACQMAEKFFGISSVIARVSDPENIDLFHRLGVTNTFSSTQLLADILEQEITHQGLRIVLSVSNDSSTKLVELSLNSKSDAVGVSLKDYTFPKSSRLVLITRSNGEVVIPDGSTIMQEGDCLLLVCEETDIPLISKLLIFPEINE